MIPPVVSRFVAGETPAEAIEHAEATNQEGIGVILNLLGEHYEERGPADADAEAYRGLIDDVETAGVDACLSVKPSQLGLDVGESAFRENYATVVEKGQESDVFVWLDMEDRTTTDATLDAFEDAAAEYGGGVGVCVQANLKRTGDDLERLADLPGKVRLVKGAYDEPADVAYTDADRVDEAYRDYLAYMFEAFDGGVAVGTHDPALIEHAVDLHEEFGTGFEFQMLMGVREDAQRDLAEEYDVYQYAPYGSKWASYFYRRVAERRENLRFALRAVLGR